MKGAEREREREKGRFNKKRIRGNEHGHNWRTRIVELFGGGGEKIGTIPGGIFPFDFVYSSFIGEIIGLICNLDSSSTLSVLGSILVRGEGRGMRRNFQASDTTPCNWRFNEREGLIVVIIMNDENRA